MDALVTAGKPAAAEACVCACHAHAACTHIGVIESRIAGVEKWSCWAQVVVGMGFRASSRVVLIGLGLATT